MSDSFIIDINGLEKTYGSGSSAVRVLRGVDLKIAKGEIVAITGPSGTGKSTLLNLIGCLDRFDKGSLLINGEDVSAFNIEELSAFRNKHIGFIFQLHNLLPEFNALENIMMPLLIRRETKKMARSKAMELLKAFNLEDRALHKPGEMSGGECQRIAVARAIAGSPEIILADEPTGSLDSRNAIALLDILLSLCREHNTTVVIVTHDMNVAAKTDRVISMLDGIIINQ
jgi:lipoprotein-releasing system ATP-binding protein